MRVLIIGASGTVGSAVVQALEKDTELITANQHSGDYQMDLGVPASIKDLFSRIGKLDAIICTAARGVIFKALNEMQIEDYLVSMQQKLFGQINLVLAGLESLNEGGSITLTTGIMNRDFVRHGTAAAMVNNAVEGFVKAAALELPKKIRLNVVSPALLEASAKQYAVLCPGFEPVSAEKVGRAYRRSLYGIQTGQVFLVE